MCRATGLLVFRGTQRFLGGDFFDTETFYVEYNRMQNCVGTLLLYVKYVNQFSKLTSCSLFFITVYIAIE